MLVSIQQSDLNIYMYSFHIRFHYGLSQDTEYYSLCCTIGPYCLGILYTVMCMKSPFFKEDDDSKSQESLLIGE